jgi:hypothetical protein
MSHNRSTVRTETVPLERLIVRDNLWSPTGQHIDTKIASYAEAMLKGVVFPPIECAELDGELLVYNGVSRKRAYAQAGITEACARIITVEDFDDVMLLAAVAHPGEEDHSNEDDEKKMVEPIIKVLPGNLPDYRLSPDKDTWINNISSLMRNCENKEVESDFREKYLRRAFWDAARLIIKAISDLEKKYRTYELNEQKGLQGGLK